MDTDASSLEREPGSLVISVRRAQERRRQLLRRQEAWLTFDPHDEATTISEGFGPLQVLKEGRLPPLAAARWPVQDAEIITYVRAGFLLYEDPTGGSGVLRAGEFQRTTGSRGARLSERNASTSHAAHVFQIWLRPSAPGLVPGDMLRRFTKAERHGKLRMVASPDGRDDALRVSQDAFLYSAILDRGQHVIHELPKGRCAWLHVVEGNVRIGDETLGVGDGAGFTDERSVSITAMDECEILLLDLAVAIDEDEPSYYDPDGVTLQA